MCRRTLLLLGFAILVNTGCGGSKDKDKVKGIRVVCTTPQVADIVRNVGGDHIHLTVLLEEEGVDPHTYQPTQKDTSELAKAEMIFYSGHHMEGKFDEIFKKMAKDKPTIAIAETLDSGKLIKDEDGNIDPHIWMDTELWANTAPAVAEELAKFDEDNAEDYKKNGESYKKALIELAATSKTKMDEIPESQRVLVTAHDAFSYFARAYGLEVKPIQGINTATEASTTQIEELVSFLVERKIKAIFTEKSVSDKNISALIEGCKKQGHTVVIGGSLYSDSMGAPGTEEATYKGMLTHNIEQLLKTLK